MAKSKGIKTVTPVAQDVSAIESLDLASLELLLKTLVAKTKVEAAKTKVESISVKDDSVLIKKAPKVDANLLPADHMYLESEKSDFRLSSDNAKKYYAFNGSILHLMKSHNDLIDSAFNQSPSNKNIITIAAQVIETSLNQKLDFLNKFVKDNKLK